MLHVCNTTSRVLCCIAGSRMTTIISPRCGDVWLLLDRGL
jgi:hypothetical protein